MVLTGCHWGENGSDEHKSDMSLGGDQSFLEAEAIAPVLPFAASRIRFRMCSSMNGSADFIAASENP